MLDKMRLQSVCPTVIAAELDAQIGCENTIENPKTMSGSRFSINLAILKSFCLSSEAHSDDSDGRNCLIKA